MKNSFAISESLGNERRQEVGELLKRLPADITMQDGSLPIVRVEFETASGDAYSLRVPGNYNVTTSGENCSIMHMNVVDLSPERKWVHVRDYIEFGDLQHPRKISHRFYLNP